MAITTRRSIVLRITLAIGFLSLAAAALIADAHPPQGYEISVYTSTPVEFWISVGLATLASIIVSFTGATRRLRAAALVLAGTTATSIIGLPLLRGYFYYGRGDPLTHLGWAKDLSSGALAPTDIFYPGIHLFANLVQTFTGISLGRSLIFVVVIFAAIYVVFVPMTVRTITDRRHAVAIATLSAIMFFPINTIAVHMHAHPFTQALLFSPLVLFLVTKYVIQPPSRSYLTGVTSIGLLLAVAGISAVLLHPQQAANLIITFAGICAVQFYYRRYHDSSPIANHRALYTQTAILTVAFAVWSAGDSRLVGNFENLRRALLGYLSGAPPVAGDRVGAQATSLISIGAGLPEMFVKLFLVSLVFTIVAGWLMLALLSGRHFGEDSNERSFVTYFAAATVGMGILTALYFAGSVAEHYFRHGGFIMILMAIVGSIGFARMAAGRGIGVNRRTGTVVVVVALVLMLPLSMITVYPSPFMHRQSQHITEEGLHGYETAFATADESLPIAGLREGPYRYSDAVHGTASSVPYDATVSEDELRNLQGRFEGSGYVVISHYDRQRSVVAYKELHYSKESFESVESQRGVNLVMSNGVVRLHHVSEGTS